MKTNFERLQMESTTIKSHYIINELKSFMQSFKTLEDDKLRSFSISGNIITIEMTINVSNSSYYSDRIIIETKISYNLSNDTYKITCHGEGARKHNYDAKRFAGYILQGIQERAGAYFVGDMSEVNSMNQFYFYDLSKENNITNTALLNELYYKLSHENMSVQTAYSWIEDNKPVEVVTVAATQENSLNVFAQTKQEFIDHEKEEIGEELKYFDLSMLHSSLSDEFYSIIENHVKSGNPISTEVYNSLNDGQKYHFNKHYNLYGNMIVNYVSKQEEPEQTEETSTTYIAFNRSFSTYDDAYNYCVSCDFSPEYIEEVNSSSILPIIQSEAVTMDLQYFSEPIQSEPIQPVINESERLSFNNYDILSLSHKEWEADVSKHNNKYLKLRDNEKLSQSDILELINSNYSFTISVINAEPYFNPDCILIDVTLCYINKGLTKYIPKNDYIYISELYNYKNVINQ